MSSSNTKKAYPQFEPSSTTSSASPNVNSSERSVFAPVEQRFNPSNPVQSSATGIWPESVRFGECPYCKRPQVPRSCEFWFQGKNGIVYAQNLGSSAWVNAAVRMYLANFQYYYPGIEEWYSRVEEETAAGWRKVYVAWNGNRVAGLAIIKPGKDAKLCHFSVSPSERAHGVGQELMALVLHQLRVEGCRSVRVTTSEEVWRRHGPFFRAAGFTAVDWQVNRYRRGASEILWHLHFSQMPSYQYAHSFLTPIAGIVADDLAGSQVERSSEFCKHQINDERKIRVLRETAAGMSFAVLTGFVVGVVLGATITQPRRRSR